MLHRAEQVCDEVQQNAAFAGILAVMSISLRRMPGLRVCLLHRSRVPGSRKQEGMAEEQYEKQYEESCFMDRGSIAAGIGRRYKRRGFE